MNERFRRLVIKGKLTIAAALVTAGCTEPPTSQGYLIELHKALEKPGSEVAIYKGTLILNPGLNHRSTPAVEDPKLTGSFNTEYANENREIVTNPLAISGGSTNDALRPHDLWIGFSHPDHGLTWVAVSPETRGLIEGLNQGQLTNCNISEFDPKTNYIICRVGEEKLVIGQFSKF